MVSSLLKYVVALFYKLNISIIFRVRLFLYVFVLVISSECINEEMLSLGEHCNIL